MIQFWTLPQQGDRPQQVSGRMVQLRHPRQHRRPQSGAFLAHGGTEGRRRRSPGSGRVISQINPGHRTRDGFGRSQQGPASVEQGIERLGQALADRLRGRIIRGHRCHPPDQHMGGREALMGQVSQQFAKVRFPRAVQSVAIAR